MYIRVKLNILLPFDTTLESFWIKFSDTLIICIQKSPGTDWKAFPFLFTTTALPFGDYFWTGRLTPAYQLHNPEAQGTCETSCMQMEIHIQHARCHWALGFRAWVLLHFLYLQHKATHSILLGLQQKGKETMLSTQPGVCSYLCLAVSIYYCMAELALTGRRS